MGKIFLNGKFVESDQACISVNDRAVLYGDSAFDTIRAYNGTPFRLDKHIDRLFRTCGLLRMQPPAGKAEISEAVLKLIEDNGLNKQGDARIRITVTGGPASGPKGLARPGPIGLIITAEPYEPLVEQYENGISTLVSPMTKDPRSPLSSVKTGNSLELLIARQEAITRGADDAIFLSAAGNISEASSSNIFLVKDGLVMTPDPGCGLLPGVTREAVLEICKEIGIESKVIMKGPELLIESEELFLTNSMVEILPVSKLIRKRYTPIPGPVTAKLMVAYKELVARETV